MEQYGRQYETTYKTHMFEREIKGELYFKTQAWNELDNTALCVAFIIMLINAVHNAIYIKYSLNYGWIVNGYTILLYF